MTQRYLGRRQKLIRLLAQAEVDSLLVTNSTNVTYLTGFTGDDSYLLLGRKTAVLLSDPRFSTQLEEECPGLELSIRRPGTSILEQSATAALSLRSKRLGIEAASLSVAAWAELTRQLAKVTLISTNGLVEQLREIKDRDEIDAIRGAIDLAQRAFEILRASLRGDQTEKQVADELEHNIRLLGGKGTSFPPIVAVGARAALPHARATGQRIDAAPFVLVDWGAAGALYKSDLTRVVVTSRIPPKLQRVYRVVLEAQERAIAAIRPGAMCSEVDQVARQIIAGAGFGRHFGHGLGHGIGLDIHEAPRLSANQQRPLKAGMVVTVEPGVYLPGWGGVRIEDDVLVTADGCEVLSSVPKQWEDVCRF